MKISRIFIGALLAFVSSGCGGGDNSQGNSSSGNDGVQQCSILDRQNWSRNVIDEWYLFPNLIDNSVNPANFSSVQEYLDALVAPARAEDKDRGFTYITSASEEDELINSGSTAGFGIRLVVDSDNSRVFVSEAFENAPAFLAGMDRGSELLAIGSTSANLQTIASLFASGGAAAVFDALGPSEPGVTRVIQFRTAEGITLEQNITKEEYALDPVSNRYGVKIFNDGNKQVGYLNLRTFIVGGADADLRDAFDQFSAQGISELIIDFRYNGGGLIRIADLMGDLMGAGRVGEVWSKTILRESKSSENSTTTIRAVSEAITPTKIAFIGRGGTASASELVINSMIPYLGGNIALIGTNTFGKPVGQFGFDRSECDDRLRAVTFKTVNADDQGEYFSGLGSIVPNTCSAADDIFTQLGDPTEASIAKALDFLAGQSCSPISQDKDKIQQREKTYELFMPRRPTAAQYQIPGLF